MTNQGGVYKVVDATLYESLMLFFRLVFFLLMLFTRSMFETAQLLQSSSLFAQAYGSGIYGCGDYQEGCTTTGTAIPSTPNTGMLLSEPSFVVPGSLLLAIIIALISTGIVKLVRRHRQNS